MSGLQEALFPITWLRFQAIMSDLGYEMVSHSRDMDGIIFRQKFDAPNKGFKTPVTVAYPDCVTGDGKTPAYEKDYVVDFLTQIAGGNGGPSIATILAKRHLHA